MKNNNYKNFIQIIFNQTRKIKEYCTQSLENKFLSINKPENYLEEYKKLKNSKFYLPEDTLTVFKILLRKQWDDIDTVQEIIKDLKQAQINEAFNCTIKNLYPKLSAQFLTKFHENIDFSNINHMQETIKFGEIETLKLLLKNDTQLNLIFKKKEATLLLNFCLEAHSSEATKIFLSHKINCENFNTDGDFEGQCFNLIKEHKRIINNKENLETLLEEKPEMKSRFKI